MRVVVTGGREYGEYLQASGLPISGKNEEIALAERRELWAVLTSIDITELAQGGARGADRWAKMWAGQMLLNGAKTYAADWSLGKRAGPVRNAHMLDHFQPDALIAFPGGTGTAGCCKLAVDRRIDILFR